MVKDFLKYLSALLIVFVSALILWPTFRINFNVGSFSYDKVWKGPDLEDLTGDRFKKEFDIKLGREFIGGSEHQVDIAKSEGEVTEEEAKEAFSIIQKRFAESPINDYYLELQKQENTFNVVVELPVSVENATFYQTLFLNTGKFDVLGEKEKPESTSLGEGATIEDYINQQYNSFGLADNAVTGTKVGKDGDSYFIRVGLSDSEGQKITNQLNLYVGKSLVGSVDNQLLPIDGEELGSQYQQYGEIRHIKVTGLTDKEQAEVLAALIESKKLNYNMQAVESTELEAVFGKDFFKYSVYVGLGAVLAITIILIILFRKEGVVASLMIGFYGMLLLVLLNILTLKVTSALIIIIILLMSLFVSLVIWGLKTTKDNNKVFIDFAEIFKTEESRNFLLEVFIPLSILILAIGLLSHWGISSFTMIWIGGLVLQIIILRIASFFEDILDLVWKFNES